MGDGMFAPLLQLLQKKKILKSIIQGDTEI